MYNEMIRMGYEWVERHKEAEAKGALGGAMGIILGADSCKDTIRYKWQE